MHVMSCGHSSRQGEIVVLMISICLDHEQSQCVVMKRHALTYSHIFHSYCMHTFVLGM